MDHLRPKHGNGEDGALAGGLDPHVSDEFHGREPAKTTCSVGLAVGVSCLIQVPADEPSLGVCPSALVGTLEPLARLGRCRGELEPQAPGVAIASAPAPFTVDHDRTT